MKKKLRLNRETLRHLTPEDTAKAAGGAVIVDTMNPTTYPTSCDCTTINPGATTNCTGNNCTHPNTLCLCPVC